MSCMYCLSYGTIFFIVLCVDLDMVQIAFI
jgi:hypothetical protein